MKVSLRIILCSLLIMGVWFPLLGNRVHAWTGGELDALDSSAITDGSISTFQTAYLHNTIDFVLPQTHGIIGYGLKSFKGIFIRFYDENDNLLYENTNPNTSWTTSNSIPPVRNVKKVQLYVDHYQNVGDTSTQIYEFDVFKMDETPPPVPTNLVAVSDTEQVQLSWNGVSASDLSGYKIYSDSEYMTTVIGTNYIVTGLTTGVNHIFTVSSVDALGNESLQSGSATAMAYPPTVPPVLTGNPDDHYVELAWDNVGTTYDVYVDGVLYDSTTDTGMIVTGLSEDTDYDFQVNAYDLYGRIVPSNLLNLHTYPERLLPPTGTTTISEVNAVMVRWGAVDSAIFAGYNVYMDGTKVNTELLTDNELDVTGLTADVFHSFRISAVDTFGRESELSPPSSSAAMSPVVTPVLSLDGTSYDSMSLKWNNSGLTYDVLLKETDGTFSVIGGTSGTSFEATGLTAQTAYDFKIRVTDKYGRVNDSNVLHAVTTAIPPPNGSRLQTISLTYNSVRLVWSDVGSSSYDVFQEDTKIATTSGLFFQVNGLTPETAYSFKVVSHDNFDRDNDSNVVSVTTKVAPPPPSDPVPPEPPPKVSTSSNAGLNDGNDYLVQGAKDTKSSFMALIAVIVEILILVVGLWFLIRVFKRKMAKAKPVSKSASSSGSRSATMTKQSSTQSGSRSFASSVLRSGNGSQNKNNAAKSAKGGSKRYAYMGKKRFQKG